MTISSLAICVDQRSVLLENEVKGSMLLFFFSVSLLVRKLLPNSVLSTILSV